MNERRQLALLSSEVVVIGLSAPGTVCATHLAQAGVGHLTLVDSGIVARSDLASHLLFTASDVGSPRAEVVKRHLLEHGNGLSISAKVERFDPHNAEDILSKADVVIESVENWQEKLLASDSCMRLAKPLIHCGLLSFSFHVFTMLPGKSACLRCVFASLGLEDFPFEGTGGELGAVAGLAGSFQAAEAIKLITSIGQVSGNHLLRFDVLRSEFDDMTELTGRPDCPDCGRWRYL